MCVMVKLTPLPILYNTPIIRLEHNNSSQATLSLTLSSIQ